MAAGQGLIALGWAPSLIPVPEVHGLAVLMAIGIAFSYRSLRAALVERDAASAHHRAVVENAAEGIYTVTLDGTVRSFNAAAEAMFGWTASEIIGQSVTTLMSAELHEPLVRFLASYASQGRAAVQRTDMQVAGFDATESSFR